MDLNFILSAIGILLSGGTAGAIITALVQRKKYGAEAHNIYVTGDISIGKTALEYAESIRHDFEKLKEEMLILRGEMKKLETRNRVLENENIVLKRENANLVLRIDKLENIMKGNKSK